MLELRPTCEHCNTPLPAHALDAMICSFECTFCTTCVKTVLENVCPTCGGGFCPRPVRPSKAWNAGLSVASHPPSQQVVHQPVDAARQRDFTRLLKHIAPEAR